MHILGILLFTLGAMPTLLMASSKQRWGPEGPVGAHMITAPLALAQCLGLGLVTGGGALDAAGLARWPFYLALPGWFVALTLLPIMVGSVRHRAVVRWAITAALGSGWLAFAANMPEPPASALVFAGGVGILLTGAGGYAVVIAMYASTMWARAAAASAAVQQQDEFQQKQAEWQRGEWAKLPAQPELWQLIQFTHSFAPEVQAAARQAVADLPDLERRMQELLGTGWAQHALSTIRDAYPIPAGPLAPALSRFYLQEAERWQTSLQGTNPSSWYYNLATYLEVAELVASDGGDLRECMGRWHSLLSGKRGLEDLADRAEALAATRC